MIGEDADSVKLSFKLTKNSDGNDPFVRTGVIIGVVFDVVATVNTIGDSEGIE